MSTGGTRCSTPEDASVLSQPVLNQENLERSCDRDEERSPAQTYEAPPELEASCGASSSRRHFDESKRMKQSVGEENTVVPEDSQGGVGARIESSTSPLIRMSSGSLRNSLRDSFPRNSRSIMHRNSTFHGHGSKSRGCPTHKQMVDEDEPAHYGATDGGSRKNKFTN